MIDLRDCSSANPFQTINTESGAVFIDLAIKNSLLFCTFKTTDICWSFSYISDRCLMSRGVRLWYPMFFSTLHTKFSPNPYFFIVVIWSFCLIQWGLDLYTQATLCLECPSWLCQTITRRFMVKSGLFSSFSQAWIPVLPSRNSWAAASKLADPVTSLGQKSF